MKNSRLLVVIALVSGVAVVHAVSFFATNSLINNWAERGQFGDSFGLASSVLSGLAFVFFALNYWHQIDTASALKAESEQRARAGEVERSIALLGVMLSVYERELAVIETQASGPEAAAAARRKESVSRKISALHAKIDLLYGEILQFIGVGDVR